MTGARAACLFVPVLCGGCSGWQSALDTKGPSANAIADLFLIFLAIAGAVWLAVAVLLAIGALRPRGSRPDPLQVDRAWEKRTMSLVATGGVATALVLVVLTGFSYAGQKRVLSPKVAPLTIEVTAHQWWWEATYAASDPSRTVKIANEIVIPAGQPVLLQLKSPDVIHSFWVPNLSGKQDLVPGRTNLLRIEASAPGTFRGQCAEFCGWQHAHMSFLVSAIDRKDFDAWQVQQAAPRVEPQKEEAKRGEHVFLTSTCVMCHSVRGTPAASHVGPDLTHVASRTTLASGTLSNSPEALAAWISDPQTIKPGVRMPPSSLGSDQMSDLVTYLTSLK